MADQLKINKRPKDDMSDDEKTDDKTKDEKQLTLGYWNIQGLGSAARMMLCYGSVDYTNVVYNQRPKEEGFSVAEWTDVKYKLGLDFPNLPWLKDTNTGVYCTESTAIYRYIGRQFKIGVQTDPELAVADQMMNKINEIIGVPHGIFIKLSYHDFSGNYPDELWKTNRADYIKALPAKLKGIEDFMKKRLYLTGDEISYADFPLYYLCVGHIKLDDSFLKTFPNLKAFYERMGATEGMKRWHTLKWSSLPCNNKIAHPALQ